MTKRQTKETVKKVVRNHCVALPEGCTVEVDSETVTIWYDTGCYDEATAAATALVNELGGTIRGNGTKWDVFYKQPVNTGDWNHRSSRWHF